MSSTPESTEPVELFGIVEGFDKHSPLRIVVGVLIFVAVMVLALGVSARFPGACRSAHSGCGSEVVGLVLFGAGLFLVRELIPRLFPRKDPAPRLRISASQIEYWPDSEGDEVVRMENRNLERIGASAGMLRLRNSDGRELEVFRYYGADSEALPTIIGDDAPRGGRFVLEYRGTGSVELDYVFPRQRAGRTVQGSVNIL